MTDLCDEEGAEAACELALKSGHDADGTCVDVLVPLPLPSLYFCNILRRYRARLCELFSSAKPKPAPCCNPPFSLLCPTFRTTRPAPSTSKSASASS